MAVIKSIRLSDQPRADAVRYEDPRAERSVRRFLRRPLRPPQVMLPGGRVAPQSDVRAYAPLLVAGHRSVFIDCANEAETATHTAAEINTQMQWQGVETIDIDGRSFSFERGYWRGPAEVPGGSCADSTARFPAVPATVARPASVRRFLPKEV